MREHFPFQVKGRRIVSQLGGRLKFGSFALYQPVAKVLMTLSRNAESIGYRPFFRRFGLLSRAAMENSAHFDGVWI